MEIILIALLRSEFNYLIKYNSIKTSSDRMISHSLQEFKKLPINTRANLLQNSLPLFEQEHEVLLIEYDKNHIKFDNAPLLNTKGICSIVPLTEMASKLLLSKLNVNFNFKPHVELSVYNSFELNRGHVNRIAAAEAILELFSLKKPEDDFTCNFKNATLTKLKNEKIDANNSIFEHLLNFDITPSFCPEGKIEAFIKSSCVEKKKKQKDIYAIKNGEIFKYLEKNKKIIEKKSFFEATKFIEENLSKNELKDKYKTMQDILTENGKYSNAFFLFSYFYYLKKLMEKNDYDIEIIKNDILELRVSNIKLASEVLFILGYTFSIQTISKSLQSYSNSLLLKEKNHLNSKLKIASKNQSRPKETDKITLEISNQNEIIIDFTSKTSEIIKKEKYQAPTQLNQDLFSTESNVDKLQNEKNFDYKETENKKITRKFLEGKEKQELEKMLGAKHKSEYDELSNEFKRKWLYNIENPKEKWKKDEYKALYYLMNEMAKVDKKVVEEEKDLMGKFHEELPMSSKINKDDFKENKVNIKPEIAKNIIKTMDNKKKEKVKEFLIKMGKSDGKFIDSEKKWLENIKKILLI